MLGQSGFQLITHLKYSPSKEDDGGGVCEEDADEANEVGEAGDDHQGEPPAPPLHADPGQQTTDKTPDGQHAR